MPRCLSGTAEEDCQHPLLTSAAVQPLPVFSAGTCVVCMWASRVPTHRGESRLSARGVAVPQSQSGKALEAKASTGASEHPAVTHRIRVFDATPLLVGQLVSAALDGALRSARARKFHWNSSNLSH